MCRVGGSVHKILFVGVGETERTVSGGWIMIHVLDTYYLTNQYPEAIKHIPATVVGAPFYRYVSLPIHLDICNLHSFDLSKRQSRIIIAITAN